MSHTTKHRKRNLKCDIEKKKKEEKRSATLDKRRYLDEDDMIVQAEDSARNNDLKGIYDVIRKISGRSTPEVVQDGKMLCSETEVINGWNILEKFIMPRTQKMT